VVPYLVGLT